MGPGDARAARGAFSAGITRGLIEACEPSSDRRGRAAFSAGITRGLIEAGTVRKAEEHDAVGFPRGLPAASLKPRFRPRWPSPEPRFSAGITRGLIEAHFHLRGVQPHQGRQFSAGITRGLIEASGTRKCVAMYVCFPRGLPAASLKRRDDILRRGGDVRFPRGLPAASLKQCPRGGLRVFHAVFRGDYPRPH